MRMIMNNNNLEINKEKMKLVDSQSFQRRNVGEGLRVKVVDLIEMKIPDGRENKTWKRKNLKEQNDFETPVFPFFNPKEDGNLNDFFLFYLIKVIHQHWWLNSFIFTADCT